MAAKAARNRVARLRRMPSYALLTASAAISAFECLILRTFLGDFFGLLSSTSGDPFAFVVAGVQFWLGRGYARIDDEDVPGLAGCGCLGSTNSRCFSLGGVGSGGFILAIYLSTSSET